MISLIKGECYKLIKGRAFWGVLAFMCFYAVLSPIAAKWYIEQVGDETYTLLSDLLAIFHEEGTFTVIGILAAIFIVGETSTGCIKQIAARGFNRVQIFLSKYITLVIANTVIILAAVVLRSLCGSILFGLGDEIASWNWIRLGYIIIGEFTGIVCFTAIYCFISYVLNNMAAAVAVNCLFISIGNIIFVLIGMALNKVELFQQYWLTGMTATIADYSNFIGRQAILCSVIFVVLTQVFTCSGVGVFKRRDI